MEGTRGKKNPLHCNRSQWAGAMGRVAELARVLGLTLRKLLPAAPRAEGAKPAGAGLDFTFPPKQ